MDVVSARERYAVPAGLHLAPAQPERPVSKREAAGFISVADVEETVNGSHGGIGRMPDARQTTSSAMCYI